MPQKVLVFAVQRWPSAARIAQALASNGFRVAAISPPGNLIRLTKAVVTHYTYRSWAKTNSITRATRQWSPDLVICCDDQAVRELQDLYVRFEASTKKADKVLVDLIAVSLGDPCSFPLTRSRSAFMPLAPATGVRSPANVVLPNDRDFNRESVPFPFPMVVKVDESFGGRGVRVAANEHQLRTAIWELQGPIIWPSTLKRLFASIVISSPLVRLLPRPRKVSAQEYIEGKPSNRAVVCWRGEVLAGISVEAVETLSQCGPASVIRVIDHPEMTEATSILVRRLNLSGFVGFDFVIDPGGQAWLVEMNPRVTPTCHLRLEGHAGLASALLSHITGAKSSDGLKTNTEKVIVLFPQELQRYPHSKYLSSFYHDVPWEEPALVRACVNESLRFESLKRILKRLAKVARSYRAN